MADLRKEGFNTIQTYNHDLAVLQGLAKAAQKTGMKLLIYPDKLMSSTISVSGIPLAAWYLVDEPDVNNMKPDDLCSLAQKVRAWDPSSLGAFVVGDGSKAHVYKGCGDILMVDWYPVPHLPLETAGENVRLTVEAAGKKPVWAVLQAMNWKDYPQHDPKKPRIGRFPDLYEIRFMTYHSILEGAAGIWYFTYSKALAETPEEWFALTTVVRELAAMRPIFEGGKPEPLPCKSGLNGIIGKAWRYHGRDYVIIANPKPILSKPVPEELLDMHWRPLFEPRRFPKEFLTKTDGGYCMPPYRVLVFESRYRFW